MSQALHEDQTRYGEEGPWHRAWHLVNSHREPVHTRLWPYRYRDERDQPLPSSSVMIRVY